MSTAESPLNDQEKAVVQALRGLQFGSVEVVVHDGRIVEVNQKRKVRFQEQGAKAARPHPESFQAHRTSGGSKEKNE